MTNDRGDRRVWDPLSRVKTYPARLVWFLESVADEPCTGGGSRVCRDMPNALFNMEWCCTACRASLLKYGPPPDAPLDRSGDGYVEWESDPALTGHRWRACVPRAGGHDDILVYDDGRWEIRLHTGPSPGQTTAEGEEPHEKAKARALRVYAALTVSLAEDT
jgi:hypothetical protein